MAQERIRKPHSRSEARRMAIQIEARRDNAGSEELKADLDALLEEIDAVLETNAEEFVAGFVQRGGE